MSEKEILIRKYPYLSYSNNLIECFSIIGYEEKLLPDIIQEYKINKQLKYSPTIISTIISDKDYGIIDNDFIIKQIFPENPEFILNNKANNSSHEEPSFKNITFSLTTDSLDSSENKIFYTCFAFVFYETYTYENNNSAKEEYFIPKTFMIISLYSFFGFFRNICFNLYKLFLKSGQYPKKEFPIEYIIYNIVNFTPSPLNHNINYFLFKDILDVPSYNLPQLSGYPIIDFNIYEIFNVLPVRLFVEIYLYTVIEQSILFFSSNLEILNMTMYIFYSLNYPFNNSTYFWHIVSIPKKDLKEENRFVGQIMTSMLGVNTQYNESIDTSAFGLIHFIVDIDNKKLILKNYNSNENIDNKNITRLYSYIHNIIDEKDDESIFLKKYIDRLIKKTHNLLKDNEIEISKNKKIEFFENINRNINRNLQIYFYNFIINILLVMYQNINFDLTSSDLKISLNKILRFEEENKKQLFNDEELLFFNFFSSSSKYKLYFEIFLGNYESNELFKIPLLFSEEFVNIKIKRNNNRINLKFPYFSLMDDLYVLEPNEYKDFYLNHLSYNYSDNKLDIYFIKEDKSSENIKTQTRKQLINFNKTLVENYIFLLKNCLSQKQLANYFPGIKIKEEKIDSTTSKEIVEKIQYYFENKNYISSSNYLIYSSIYIFLILTPLLSNEKILFYINKLLAISKNVDFFLRYYLNLMIQTFYKYHLINNKKKNFPNMIYDNMKLYIYLLFNALKEEKILPNEDMILIYKIFEEKNIIKNNIIQLYKVKLEAKLSENIKKNEFDLSNYNISIFMRYNFDSNRIYNEKEVTKIAMKELKECNITIDNTNSKFKSIIIDIKIKDKKYSGKLFSPLKIFKEIKKEFNDFEKSFSLGKIKINIIKEILINLMQYSFELKEFNILSGLFIDGLYFLDKLNEKK